MLNLPQSTCGYPDHLKIETCRQNALLHTRFVWQTYEFPGHSNENDDVRFGSKADIRAASILLKSQSSARAIGTTLVDDSRCGRFLFDRFCDPQHRNLPINLALAEMGNDHGRETPPRKSVVVLSISRWPLAE